MKYAYYEAAATEEEKQARLAGIKAAARTDPDYYSAYLEVAPAYDAPLYKRKALNSLKAAIKRGKVEKVVISSLENLAMEELTAAYLLEELGVPVALGDPGNVLSREDIERLVFESQESFLMTKLAVPLITMDYCYVWKIGGRACVSLETEHWPQSRNRAGERMTLIEAVEKNLQEGFYLFREDVMAWYFVPDYLAERMKALYEIGNETLLESIGLQNP